MFQIITTNVRRHLNYFDVLTSNVKMIFDSREAKCEKC